ncbi:MAG: carbon-nitrogen hydrolase family protein [Acidobacteriota bacterium]
MAETLRVALIAEVFFDETAGERLLALLQEARRQGAELAVLPEIPLNPWSPATRSASDDDAESVDGRRHRLLAEVARSAGIGVLGGAIVRDPASGERRNQSLVYDAKGSLLARYSKLHLPEEDGFWETSHYGAGTEAPAVIHGFALPFGIQICSDNNRPEGTHLLAAQGAEAVIVPRATERKTWERWRTVFIANALTSCCYVLSVNRPRPEQGVLLGGASIAVAPDGEILVQTLDTLALVTLERQRVLDSRIDYPGYLPIRSELYAAAWGRLPARRGYGRD